MHAFTFVVAIRSFFLCVSGLKLWTRQGKVSWDRRECPVNLHTFLGVKKIVFSNHGSLIVLVFLPRLEIRVGWADTFAFSAWMNVKWCRSWFVCFAPFFDFGVSSVLNKQGWIWIKNSRSHTVFISRRWHRRRSAGKARLVLMVHCHKRIFCLYWFRLFFQVSPNRLGPTSTSLLAFWKDCN